MASYVMSLVFFMVHAALCFNIVDERERMSDISICCMSVIILGGMFSGWTLRKMKSRLRYKSSGLAHKFKKQNRCYFYLRYFCCFGDDEKLLTEQWDDKSAALLLHEIGATTSRSGTFESRGKSFLTKDIGCEGYMEKKGAFSSRHNMGVLAKWNKRYFFLEGSDLYQFENEASCSAWVSACENRDDETQLPPLPRGAKEINLDGFEVLVVGAANFILSPIIVQEGSTTGSQKIVFRCECGGNRRTWVMALATATYSITH